MQTTPLLDYDLHHALATMPADVRELVADQKLIVAGGFVRARVAGEAPSDIDLFGPSKEALDTAAGLLQGLRAGKKRQVRLIRTDNAITIAERGRLTVQFITRWLYTDAKKLIGHFDFTIAAAAIWQGAEPGHPSRGVWQSAAHQRFYADLAARRLHYTAPDRTEDAGGSMLRVVRFLRKGYSIDLPSLAGVIERLVDGEGPSRDSRQATLLARLREVDPLRVVDGVVLSDEHGNQEAGDA